MFQYKPVTCSNRSWGLVLEVVRYSQSCWSGTCARAPQRGSAPMRSGCGEGADAARQILITMPRVSLSTVAYHTKS